MKKIVSLLLAALMLCSAAAALAGCGIGDGNYPVTVANFTIEKEPTGIVVLDPSAADIISYMSYDGKIVGRSTEVNQKYLAVAPDFGAAASPDTQAIISSGAQIVFAGDKIDPVAVTTLEDAGLKVIKMSLAGTPKGLETNYLTIGKILGGATTGAEKGETAYGKLIEHMEKLKVEATAAAGSSLSTACYLFVDDGALRVMTSGTYVDMLIGYTDAANVAVNLQQGNVDVNTLRIANPNFIFYADDATLNAVKSDDVLSTLTAVVTNHILEISDYEITRQGLTALETLEKMIYFMHPELDKNATPDEAAAVAPTDARTAATQPAAQTATQAANARPDAEEPTTEAPHSEADRYQINLTDELSLKTGDSDPEAEEGVRGDVFELQHRLWNLDYILDLDDVTGYYGEVTAQAVKDFQQAVGLPVTGEADNQTLQRLFMSDAPAAVLPATTAPAQ